MKNLVANLYCFDVDEDGYSNACLVSPICPPCSSTRGMLSNVSDSETLRSLSLSSVKVNISSLDHELVNATIDASSNGTVVDADLELVPLPEFGDGGTLLLQCAISYRTSTECHRNQFIRY